MKVILFDIDGTLVTAGGAGTVAFNQTFVDFYNVNNICEGLSCGGKTDDLIIIELFHKAFQTQPDPNEILKIKTRYIEYFAKSIYETPRFKILPHAKETVEHLAKQENVLLGIATGNYKEPAYHKLKRAELDHHFSFGGFACDGTDREVLTQKAHERALEKLGHNNCDIFIVGDTPRDIECAHHIGAKAIAVTTGRYSKNDLTAYKPEFLLSDLSEFPEI